MTPALHPGDYVIARRGQVPFRRGEIVVYRHPDRPGFDLVKRVVGQAGEQVDISGGQVHIQGHVLAEPWADGPALGDGSWSLGPEEVFVLGDRRSQSADDSRSLGGIPFDSIEATVRFRYWPPTRFGKV